MREVDLTRARSSMMLGCHPPHKAWDLHKKKDSQLKSNASWCSRRFFFEYFLHPSPGNPAHVAGPYSLNGVPLKRVNQRYCIATSAKVDLGAAEARRLDQSFSPKGGDTHGI